MTFTITLTKTLIFPLKSTHSHSPESLNPNPNNFFSYKSPTRFNSLHKRVINSVHPKNNSSSQNPLNINNTHSIHHFFILFSFSLILLCLRIFSNALLPNFTHRWRRLIAFSREAESKTNVYPSYLWHAIVAYEDRRFFNHFGIDPVGLSRAVLSFSALGGGSTITQQLVKNTFLKCERTISRKIVEMLLALALERTMSKRGILSSYMSKIYWGHGIYGIKSASIFYFGKHPSLLSLGEAALLAGMIPAPELRSPLKDPSRGKTFQARVLKRMVEVGFLDIETALMVVKQSLHPRGHGPHYTDGVLYLLSFNGEELVGSNKLKQGDGKSTFKDIWDWEKESNIWEACEDMERWAIKVRHGTSAKFSGSYDKMHIY